MENAGARMQLSRLWGYPSATAAADAIHDAIEPPAVRQMFAKRKSDVRLSRHGMVRTDCQTARRCWRFALSRSLVGDTGLEPVTSALSRRRSPS